MFLVFFFQYPHLVHAAVASSAPVRAITNFEGYNEVVAASLASKIVGGSDQVGVPLGLLFFGFTVLSRLLVHISLIFRHVKVASDVKPNFACLTCDPSWESCCGL